MMLSLLGDNEAKTKQQDEKSTRSDGDDDCSLEDLKQRLTQLRQERRQVARVRQELGQHLLPRRLNQLRLQRQVAVESYQSIVVQRQALAQYLNLAVRWNVWNDCFHIWHAGPWATINGARFGGEAPRLPAGLQHLHSEPQPYHSGLPVGGNGSTNHSGASSATTSTTSNVSSTNAPPPRRYFLWSSVAPAPHPPSTNGDMDVVTTVSSNVPSLSPAQVAATTGTNTAYHHHHHQQQQDNNNNNKVPWPEINAALGHIVLLLQVLQDQCGSTFSTTHELIPMASTSQIGIRRRAPKSLLSSWTTSNDSQQQPLLPPVIHNLYFEESSFALFKGGALRQFNIGLGALLECLVQIQQQSRSSSNNGGGGGGGNSQQHPTIVFPHAIQQLPSSLSNSNSNSNCNSNEAQDNNFGTGVGIMTIGGIPFQYNEGTAVEFTRACKYFLTNLKWLVAHAVKHHHVVLMGMDTTSTTV